MATKVELAVNGETNKGGEFQNLEMRSIKKEKEANMSSEPTISVLGNGNYGKALAMRFREYGFPVHVGSRSPKNRKSLPSGVSLVSYKMAAEQGDIIFACIPVTAYRDVLQDLQSRLKNKIIVDVSNPSKLSDECGAHRMARILPESHIVKALNTIPAWAFENDAFGATKKTFVCGDNKDARSKVKELLSEIGCMPVDQGRLKVADGIEKLSLRLFQEWRFALMMTGIVLCLCLFYYYLRLFGANQNGSKNLEHLALYHANRMLCWIALWMFSLVYFAGCLAGYIQIVRGTKYKPFPQWLDLWMKSRKQMGLIALLCVSMHCCLSLIVLAAEQVKYMSVYTQIPGTKIQIFQRLIWNAEPSLLFATISITAFAVLGIASLPTVNARMSWREWDFIQSKIGYTGLVFGTAHVLMYGYGVYEPKTAFKFWKWDMPPAIFIMPMLPLLVLLMKLILILPGISHYLRKIRMGWQRNPENGGYTVA